MEEESWNAVNEGSLRAVESTPNWQLYDIRYSSKASQQGSLSLLGHFGSLPFEPAFLHTPVLQQQGLQQEALESQFSKALSWQPDG